MSSSLHSSSEAEPSKHHLKQGLLEDDLAFFLCARSDQPYVVDHEAGPDTDPHGCMCDSDRHVLVEPPDPDTSRLLCGVCEDPIEIAESDTGGQTCSYDCSCGVEGWSLLPKSTYRDNAGVFL